MTSRTRANLALVTAKDTPIERARRAADEARRAAISLAGDLISDLDEMAIQCAEIAALDALPAGQRDAIMKLGQRIAAETTTLNAIRARS